MVKHHFDSVDYSTLTVTPRPSTTEIERIASSSFAAGRSKAISNSTAMTYQLEKLSLAALWLKADATTVELSAGFRRLDRRNRPKSTDLAFFIRELFAKSPLCSSAAT
jgi:hypothetical protein